MSDSEDESYDSLGESDSESSSDSDDTDPFTSDDELTEEECEGEDGEGEVAALLGLPPKAPSSARNPAISRITSVGAVASAELKQQRRRSIRGSFYFEPGGDTKWLLDPKEWDIVDDEDVEPPPARTFLPRHMKRYPILGGVEYVKLATDPPNELHFPVHCFAYSGHVTLLDRYARKGLSLNVKDVPHGRLPLHYACMQGQVLTVYFLLRRPDVHADSVDSLGFSPLAYATFNGHDDIVRMLLSRGGCNEMRVIPTSSAKRDLISLAHNGTTMGLFTEARQKEADFAHLVDEIGGVHRGRVPEAVLNGINSVNVNCRVMTDDRSMKISLLEIACQRVGNEEAVAYLLENHCKPTDRLARYYPEYQLLLRLWLRRWQREQSMRKLFRHEQRFCEDVVVLSREIGKSIKVWGDHQISSPKKKRLLDEMYEALVLMGQGHRRLQKMMLTVVPLLKVWTPEDTDLSWEILPDDDVLDAVQFEEDEMIQSFRFAPGETWFDQAKFMRAFEVYLPFQAYRTYASVVEEFEHLLMSEEHADFREFVEQLARNRTHDESTTIHDALFKPIKYLTTVKKTLHKILHATDPVSDDDIYEHTKHSYEMFQRYEEEAAEILQMFRSRHVREDALAAAVEVLRSSYRTSLDTLLGRMEASETTELMWFGRREDLDYVDLVPVQVIDDRFPTSSAVGSPARSLRSLRRKVSIPDRGPGDIFVFPNSIAFGSAGKAMCRYGTHGTKFVFRYGGQGFRVSVYGENAEVMFDRQFTCAPGKGHLSRELYESIRLLPQCSDPISTDGKIKPREGVLRWLHLPRFDDQKLANDFVSVLEQDGES